MIMWLLMTTFRVWNRRPLRASINLILHQIYLDFSEWFFLISVFLFFLFFDVKLFWYILQFSMPSRRYRFRFLLFVYQIDKRWKICQLAGKLNNSITFGSCLSDPWKPSNEILLTMRVFEWISWQTFFLDQHFNVWKNFMILFSNQCYNPIFANCWTWLRTTTYLHTRFDQIRTATKQCAVVAVVVHLLKTCSVHQISRTQEIDWLCGKERCAL